MNSQEPSKIINIDNVGYYVEDLSPEIVSLVQLMNTTNKKIQEAQSELAISSAAYTQFGASLREKLANIKSVDDKVNTVRTLPKKKK